MPENDDASKKPKRERPSLETHNSVLDALAGVTGGVSRVNLRDDASSKVSTPVRDPQVELPEGRGHYKVLDEIARGGMGVVLRSHDADLGRDVAMKVLHEELAGRPDVVQRFVEEAQIGGQLQHPGIVPVYELGLMADERPYFTMKLVKGQTLAKLLADRAGPEDERARLLSVFESICQTVAYAHSKGVIHRDLKPANVMVGAFGEVQVVDWGLAKVLSEGGIADELRAKQMQQHTIIETVRSGPGSSGSDSMAGSVLGTPAYMAPEQAMGELEKVDERSDVFSLGAILCELVTGLPPYVENEEERLVVQAARARLDPARERIAAAGADGELKELCLECLTPGQAARPRDAGEVAQRVHAYLAGLETRATEAVLSAERDRIQAEELRRRQRLTLALAATVVLSLVGLGLGLRAMEKSRDTRRRQELVELQETLDDARERVAQLQAEGQSSEALEAARAALDRMRDDAAQGTEELTGQAERLVQRAEERVARELASAELADRNARLLARCEGLRMQQIEANFGFTPPNLIASLEEQYLEAFRAWGVDPDADDLTEALEELRTSGIAVDLALALDDWTPVRAQVYGIGSAKLESIGALAFDLDPDPARTRIREALAAWDEEQVLELARTEDLSALPASTIWVLSQGMTGLALRRTGRVRLLPQESEIGRDVLRVVREGAAAHPGDFLLNFRLGDLLSNARRHHAALAALTTARALRPDNGAVLGLIGDAHNALGDSPSAVAAYLEAIRLRPDYRRIWRFTGDNALRCGQFALAKEMFEKQASVTPGNPRMTFLARFSEWMGGTLERSQLDALMATAPSDGELKEWRSWLAWGLQRHPDPAQRDGPLSLQIMLEVDPTQRSLQDDPDWILAYLLTGEPERALELLEEFSPLGERDGPAFYAFKHFMHASALHDLGRIEEAKKHLAWAEEGFTALRDDSIGPWQDSALEVLAKRTRERFEG